MNYSQALQRISIGGTVPVDPNRSDLYKEVDYRFWKDTGYEPGIRLDPKDPKDVPYIAIWMKLYDQVKSDGMMTFKNDPRPPIGAPAPNGSGLGSNASGASKGSMLPLILGGVAAVGVIALAGKKGH